MRTLTQLLGMLPLSHLGLKDNHVSEEVAESLFELVKHQAFIEGIEFEGNNMVP